MNKLNTYIVLDRSGSMAGPTWVETLGSINGYVAELVKKEVDGNVTVVAFDSVNAFEIIRDSIPVNNFPAITPEELQPRGGTPLYDATMRTILKAMQDNNERSLFVVMTDGMENTSQYFGQDATKQMIKYVTDVLHWEVVFLGANFDAKLYTDNLGLGAGKYVNTTNATRAATMANLALKASAYSAAADVNVGAAAMNFTVQEQKVAEEK